MTWDEYHDKRTCLFAKAREYQRVGCDWKHIWPELYGKHATEKAMREQLVHIKAALFDILVSFGEVTL